MNRYLTLDPGFGKPADRYYGRVDSVEVIDNQRSELLIQVDAVAADDFDSKRLGAGPLTDAMEGLELAVLEFSSLSIPQPLTSSLGQILEPGRWLEVREARPHVTSVDVDYYPGLFADGVTRASEITLVDEKLALKLSEAFSMDDIADATGTEIGALLDPVPPADFVTVFDVGQGNLNALWQSNKGATLYFDFGGGVTANTRTYPKKPLTPCLTGLPPVVLSHWDWDHWSSVGRYTQALNLHWIVPRCVHPGAHHRAFAWALHRLGHLHFWPRNMPDYQGAYFRIEKCTGVGRNDSGLAMTVYGEKGGDFDRKVLLTGDAAYDCIPEVQARKTQFGAVVASHHGAIVSSITEAKPSVSLKTNAALVYSVGHGNGFGHPRLHAELDYLLSGWLPDNTYSTAQYIRSRPNAIGIRLSSNPIRTGCGTCNPKLIC